MDNLMLFTDASVDVQTKIGFGAYLVVYEPRQSLENLKKCVQVKRFEQTSSTKLELQTLLWALGNIHTLGKKVTVYTDSQNIVGLSGRRKRLEQNNFHTKKNKRLNNYELYQQYFRMTNQIDPELVKVRGHQVDSQKNEIDWLFNLVDRASRNSLRREMR